MSNIYEKLIQHQKRFSEHSLNELFQDLKRSEKYNVQYEDFYFDFSKNFVTQETFNLLFELAEEKNLSSKIELLFKENNFNFTENRSALHTALRNFSKNPVVVNNEDIMPQIINIREKMKKFVEHVIHGKWLGYRGDKIQNIVNIGIGGSHLGPAMVTNALKHYNSHSLNIYFVSNVDGDEIHDVLNKIELSKTIFIIVSKTFTTLETMENAKTAKKWFMSHYSKDKEAIEKHFVAVSTNIQECENFGIKAENIFQFWDWVGGRYSVWSAVGLSVALAIGWNHFEEFLRGAYEIDRHFRSTPFQKNIPVILALISYWYSTYWHFSSQAVIPYSYYLTMFPEFLQQLKMESNGKSVNSKGNNIQYNTEQVIWGEVGTNSQHSFFQLLHQGTETIPVDFIGFIEPLNNNTEQHWWLLSNMIAQSEALMKGKNQEEVEQELNKLDFAEQSIEKIAPHKVFKGNRPSNTIIVDKLTPKSLGKLIAIYEHCVFVEGVLWEINSFDQWGVELGKQLANKVHSDLLMTEKTDSHDSSTNSIINFVKMKNFWVA